MKTDYTDYSKYIKYIFGIILLLFLWSVFATKCSNQSKNEVIKVNVPEVKDSIIYATKVEYVEIASEPQKIYIEGEMYEVENPINDSIVNELMYKNDSLTILKKYLKAVGEKEQIRTFDKDGITVNVKSRTRGDLLEQSIDYTIKEKQIEIPKPKDKDVFSFLLGGGVKQNIEDRKLNFGVDAGIRVENVNVIFNANTNKEIGITILRSF